ncbi:hypothetical protein Ssi03_69050 [Sphaerisporangium siamense]|nr:hypothetical protein Ssi03_69050 [Sphaerisporangium siamense]
MITAADLLSVWESGADAGNAQRAVLLHAVARPEAPDLLDAPVGARDAELFALRRSLFGARIPVLLSCPECGERLEFDFDTRAVPPPEPSPVEPITLTVDSWTVVVRVPTSGDLLVAARSASPRAVLLERCVPEARRDGEPVPVAALPAEVVARVAEAAGCADPGADVRLDVRCPECGRMVRAGLDITLCLWTELDAWARATLLEVSLLAASYGWDEADILAMSSARRRCYLELAGHA